MLERYRRILSGKQKPKFIISGNKINRLVKDIDECKVDVVINDNDDELEPLHSASLYFSGSMMKYIYGNKKDIGKRISTKQTAKWIDLRAKEGKSIVISPGNIMESIPRILKILSMVKSNIPIVLKTDGYYSENIANSLKDIVDVYIINFKFFSNECSMFLSSTEDYVDTVKRNILIAERYGDLIIEHQLLPSHIECDSKPIVEWINNNLKKKNVRISADYKPEIGVCEEISRRISIAEYNDLIKHAKSIGLEI